MLNEEAEIKAQKIAAAKKKLREYQLRTAAEAAKNASGSSSISEKSNSELSLNGQVNSEDNNATPQTEVNTNNAFVNALQQRFTQPIEATPNAASYFNAVPVNVTDSFPAYIAPVALEQQTNNQYNVNAIQLLIQEKAQLTTELNKYKTVCREKDLELEELGVQLSNISKRQDELQKRVMQEHQTVEKTERQNAELMHKYSLLNADHEEQVAHLDELRRQLAAMQTQNTELTQQFKEKCNENEMAQIRIRQLSDEANVSKDNRVETLTQTQFMYEQQIRDLQAMVQQLTQDKEQANLQYQNYVQHLNTEVTKLNEKNTELVNEHQRLQERERQLVEHISGLERDIQKNISRQQEQLRMKQDQENVENLQRESNDEIGKLKETISDFDSERHEFQLKIKSQEDRLDMLNNQLSQKNSEIENLTEQFERVSVEQPDKEKLLATMESDKVAASRALSQNIELKKQLDELEIRFVQLTNDKAELMNKLDSEEYANREMRSNYNMMEDRIHTMDERFKFKDDEMIRLSHENVELVRINVMLKHQLKKFLHTPTESTMNSNENVHMDAMQELNYEHSEEKGHEHKHDCSHHDHDHSHDHNHSHDHDHSHDNDHSHDHEHSHDHGHTHDHEHSEEHNPSHAHSHSHEHECSEEETFKKSQRHSKVDRKIYTYSESDSCQEAQEDNNDNTRFEQHNIYTYSRKNFDANMPHIATADAVEKLQQRFTQLMSQVADLTDEKQRLEHLVLQLQGETETIGEYITLYQTQRRILKQREYEKAAQMKLLQIEREQLREKISALNNLVSSLNVELPKTLVLKNHLNAALEENITDDTNINESSQHPAVSPDQVELQNDLHFNVNASNNKMNSQNSQQIISKIQDIIQDIKENTKDVPMIAPQPTVDHLNCCLGKFEVV